jgi:predicted small lipoprotein YifL
MVITFFILLLGVAGLTACGKAGDPYRPSDIPKESSAT